MVFTNFSPLSSHRTGTVRKSLNSYQIGKADRLQDADEETFLQSKDKLQKIKSSEGMMPGTLLLLPEGMHFCDITPLAETRRAHWQG